MASGRSDVEALLSFFGVSSPNGWDSVWKAANIAYRQTRRFHTTAESISVWVRTTELVAASIETTEFSEARLRSLIDTLRHCTRQRFDEAIPAS
jgi:hypothetical protein